MLKINVLQPYIFFSAVWFGDAWKRLILTHERLDIEVLRETITNPRIVSLPINSITLLNNHLKRRMNMYSYGLLEPGCYYLIQEEFDSIIELVKVTVETDHCLYVFKYQDELITEWRRKTDSIYDIIECLDDRKVEAWEKQYNSNNEESYYEEDEE